MTTIKNLTTIANKLDQSGLTKAADYLDRIITKLAQHDTDADFDEDDIDLTETELVEPTDAELAQIEDEENNEFKTFEDYEGVHLPSFMMQLEQLQFDAHLMSEEEKSQLQMAMEELMLAITAEGVAPMSGFQVGQKREHTPLVAEAKRRK